MFIVISWMFFGLALAANLVAIGAIRSARRMMGISLSTDPSRADRGHIAVLRRMVNSDSGVFLREYVTENAPIFYFSFAADLLSPLFSILQIIAFGIGLFSIFDWNPVILVAAVSLFCLSGYSGSRFNKKAMLQLFAKKSVQGNLAIGLGALSSPETLLEGKVSRLMQFHDDYVEALGVEPKTSEQNESVDRHR